VQRIISVSAVGSMKEAIAPGHIVIPDQFFDRTQGQRASPSSATAWWRTSSFADPVCCALSTVLIAAARTIGVTVHSGGTYLCIEGPNFSIGLSRMSSVPGVSTSSA